MRDRDKEALLLLLLVWAYTSSGDAAPAVAPEAPRPRRRRDPSMIDVGWWWYWFPPELDARVATWRQAQRSAVVVRKTFGSASVGATVIVFEVTKRHRWTLPGLPEPAPRGIDTDLSDVAWAIPEPPSALRRMVESAAKQSWEYLRQLYQGTRPPRAPMPGRRGA